MLSFKLIPHTADVILKVEATTIEELFQASVFGLISVLKPENIVINNKSVEAHKFTESNNVNLLLVDFLSEILTLMHIKKCLVSDIIINNLTETSVDYKIYLQYVERFEKDVKAISYHNVQIKLNDQDYYEAEIIFDI